MIDPKTEVTVTVGELEDLIAYVTLDKRSAIVNAIYVRAGIR